MKKNKLVKEKKEKQDINIFSYTANQAIADGYLFDVGKVAKEAGFKIPVRITPGVLEWLQPSNEAKEYGQEHDGRLWDLLQMARIEILKSKNETLLPFYVEFFDGPKTVHTVKFWACLDNTSGLAIHIMLPSEY